MNNPCNNLEIILIIPDTHGLSFWREAVSNSKAGKIIFLGDYVDPYETMDWYEVFVELSDIIQFKKANSERVTLLWGNHDLSYLYRFLRGSRYDYRAADSYLSLFFENRDCFQVAEEACIKEKRFLFTHAGVNGKWLLANKKVFEKYAEINAPVLNALGNDYNFLEALSNISRRRGGICEAGSMIWADCHEFEAPDSELSGYIQIFGHTRQTTGEIWHNSNHTAYCLDCGKAFKLDASGIFEAK